MFIFTFPGQNVSNGKVHCDYLLINELDWPQIPAGLVLVLYFFAKIVQINAVYKMIGYERLRNTIQSYFFIFLLEKMHEGLSYIFFMKSVSITDMK